MNRAIARMITADMEAACAEVARKHGVTITSDGGSLGLDSLTAKFRIETIAVNGDDGKPAVSAAFLSACRGFGLPEDLMGRTFKSGPTTYTVTGFKLTRYKYPVSATGPRGGKYKFPVATVKAGLI